LRGGSFQAGGALHMAVMAELRLVDCVLEGNSTTGYGGGAVFASRGRVALERCTVRGNAGGTGGALLADGVSKWDVRDTKIIENSGRYGGALALRDGAQVTLEGVTISGNSGEMGGGAAVYLQGTTTRGPKLVIRESIVEGGAPAIFNEEGRGTVEGG
jgi:hypothetical protein